MLFSPFFIPQASHPVRILGSPGRLWTSEKSSPRLSSGHQAGVRGKQDPAPQRGLKDATGHQGGTESWTAGSSSRRNMGLRNGVEAWLPCEEQTSHGSDWWKDRQTRAGVTHSQTCYLALDKCLCDVGVIILSCRSSRRSNK